MAVIDLCVMSQEATNLAFEYEKYAKDRVRIINHLCKTNYTVKFGMDNRNTISFDVVDRDTIYIVLPKDAFSYRINQYSIVAYEVMICHILFRVAALDKVEVYKPAGRNREYSKRLFESIDILTCDIGAKSLFGRELNNSEYAEYMRLVSYNKYVIGKHIKGNKCKDIIDPVNRVCIMSKFRTTEGFERELTHCIDRLMR